jgi:HAD superfamily hydrolase (TIGR01509 family)
VDDAPRLPAAAVFDWDGTLADTLPLIYRANVVALRELGIELSRTWFRERYTPDWRSSYRALGVPAESWEQLGHRWSEEMARGRPRALPWARPALRRLRRHGVRLGLVTASTRGVVEPSIARLGLDGVFETAYFSDDVTHTKPHPEALLRALADMGVDPADTVYVGDTTIDMEMAVAAGARFVAVGTTTTEAAFREAGVDRVWSGVGAWTDDLLERSRVGSGESASLSRRRPPPRESRPSAGGSAARRRTG